LRSRKVLVSVPLHIHVDLAFNVQTVWIVSEMVIFVPTRKMLSGWRCE